MQTEQQIRDHLKVLEASADEWEDAYYENFVAIRTLREILEMPAPVDYRRKEED